MYIKYHIQTARMSEGAGEHKGDPEADRLEGQPRRATRDGGMCIVYKDVNVG